MQVIVVNKYREPFDIDISRSSIYGNPYRITRNHSRTHVLCLHMVHAKRNRKMIQQLYSDCVNVNKEVVRLGCYCAPLGCHGDNLIALLQEFIGRH